MIINVEAKDVFSLTREPAEAFFAESKIDGTLYFDHFCMWWANMISIGAGIIMVSRVGDRSTGIIGGLTHQCFMTRDMLGTECFWWVAPELRDKSPTGMRLFLAWEEEMRKRNIKRLYVGNLMSIGHEKMGDLYKRLGYKPLETHYVKSI